MREECLCGGKKPRGSSHIVKIVGNCLIFTWLFATLAVSASWSQSPPERPAQRDGNTPTYRTGGAATPKYGGVETPKFGDVPMHPYGLVPMESSNVPSLPSDAPAAPQNENTGGPSPDRPVSAGDSGPAAPAAPAKKADFTGRYYGYEGKTLHTWDFYADGTFLHTRIVSGAGTSVRDSKRGDFRLDGEYLELKIGKATTGAVTPGIGGRETLIAGGTEAKTEVRRLKIQFLKDGKEGILLDGKPLKVKTW